MALCSAIEAQVSLVLLTPSFRQSLWSSLCFSMPPYARSSPSVGANAILRPLVSVRRQNLWDIRVKDQKAQKPGGVMLQALAALSADYETLRDIASHMCLPFCLLIFSRFVCARNCLFMAPVPNQCWVWNTPATYYNNQADRTISEPCKMALGACWSQGLRISSSYARIRLQVPRFSEPAPCGGGSKLGFFASLTCSICLQFSM